MSEERTHHVTVSLARNDEFVAEFPDVPARIEKSPLLSDRPGSVER
jgi:hypothetical protein